MAHFKSYIQKILLTFALTAPAIASAQNAVLEKLASLPQVEYSYLSSEMLSKAEDLSYTSTNINQILSQLNSIEVLNSDEDEESYNKIRSEIQTLNVDMKLISRIQNDGKITRMFGMPSRENVSSYSEILFIKDDPDNQEITAILFTGNIQPDAIKDLLDD